MGSIISKFQIIVLGALLMFGFSLGPALAAEDYSDYDENDIEYINVVYGYNNEIEVEVKIEDEDEELDFDGFVGDEDDEDEVLNDIAEHLQSAYMMRGNFGGDDLEDVTEFRSVIIAEAFATINYPEDRIDMELEYTDGREGYYQIWDTTDKDDVYADLGRRTGEDAEDAREKVDVDFSTIGSPSNDGYAADRDGLTFSKIEDITIQAGDKDGYIATLIDFGVESVPVYITLRYQGNSNLDNYLEALLDEMQDTYGIGGSYNEDDIEAIADIDVNFTDYGSELEQIISDLDKLERCEEFSSRDITRVQVKSNGAFSKDLVTVEYLDDCEYSYQTTAYKIDSGLWKGYLIEEITDQLNNRTQLRITGVITYQDIAEEIEFDNTYATDSVPTYSEYLKTKPAAVEVESDTDAMRNQLIELIKALLLMLEMRTI